jgi:predicted nucleic acid-binding protein
VLLDTNVFINALAGRGPAVLRLLLEAAPRLFVAAPARAELAGRTVRAVAGGGGKIATAFDRVELISDALTAILAARSGFTVVTEDADFDVLTQLVPGLQVLFYDRHGGG